MSAAEGLLGDIVASPEDDTPRLVYADWLEEHDQPDRAEIIRLQIERSKLPEDDARAAKLLRREKALLKQHGAEWCDTHLGMMGELRRGFLEHVTCWPHNALEAGAELVEKFPVRSLCLKVDGLDAPKIRQLARQPWLARLRALRFIRSPQTTNGSLSDSGLEAILKSPHLGNLEVLELPSAEITSAGVLKLAEAGHLKSLRELDLTWCRIGQPGMYHLSCAAHLAGLTRLKLEGTWLGPEGAETLAASTHLRQLRHLDVARCRIQITGMRALVASPVLATVERLRLGRMRLAIRAAQCLGRCRYLENLRELDLCSNRMADDGAAALAEGAALAGLTTLLLRSNRISAAGVSALAKATHWKLRHLDLARNNLSDAEKKVARGWFGAGIRVRL
jgi:uncharacterized protein (TIGR02996 family)